MFEEEGLLRGETKADGGVEDPRLVLHAHQGRIVGEDLAAVGLGVGGLDEPLDPPSLVPAGIVETNDARRQGPTQAPGRRVGFDRKADWEHAGLGPGGLWA